MKYQIEHDKDDRDIITIHLDINLFHFRPKTAKKWPANNEDTYFNCDTPTPLFLNRLMLMEGVQEVYFEKYSIDIIKGRMFSWRRLIPKIIEDLRFTLNGGAPAEKKDIHRNKPVKKVLVRQTM